MENFVLAPPFVKADKADNLRNYCNQSFFTIIMSDSTSILDLPTDPVGGGSVNGNISLTAQESIKQQNNQHQQPGQGMSLDQTTINQIVNSLQQATLAGATQLPSRDIPMTTTTHITDPQVVPNYVPPPTQDYIKNHERTSDMVHDYNKEQQRKGTLDDMYDEIQTPLLLAVLYFLFQLPFFKRFLYTYIPFLFSNDGNYNINGFLFTSIMFGMLFHLLMKATSYFGAF